ncbi:MAG: response regulator [Acidimicrobiia bacterium]|nr:response regulator [Acidimicrobiia bacterium]
MSRVLIVDDEPQILRALAITMRANGYEVVTADTGQGAVQVAAETAPDAVILDLGLPDITGVEVVEALRGWTTVPIVILSVRNAEADKIAALDAGADDYMTKPFGVGELLARLRAALRRAVPGDVEARIETPDFTIDLADKQVRESSGAGVHLTPTEWQVLELLARHAERLVTQRQILTDIWGATTEDDTGFLRVHMAHLRRKLEPDPSKPRYLVTEPGMGYRFMPGGGSAE